jgi:hypothetical protein
MHVAEQILRDGKHEFHVALIGEGVVEGTFCLEEQARVLHTNTHKKKQHTQRNRKS